MSASRMHGFTELEGAELDAVAQKLAGIDGFVGPIGTPLPVCASCGKPWTVARKPRHVIPMIATDSPGPVILVYRICGSCSHQYRHGGLQREAVLASVERFIFGGEVQA